MENIGMLVYLCSEKYALENVGLVTKHREEITWDRKQMTLNNHVPIPK